MKKKEKEFIHKPDLLLTWFESTIRFIRENLKLCIIALAILFVAAASGYAYKLHLDSQYDKIQYQLAQGIQSFNEYIGNEKKEDIEKAEAIFTDVAQKKKGESYFIAKLYLAKINYSRGKNEDAKKIYQEIIKDSSSSALRVLSEKAIQHIDKK